MSNTQSQQSDGTWKPAEPTPYADTIDWEVYGKGRERRAVAYWHADKLAEVGPGPFFRLRVAITHRRLRKATR